MNFNPKTELQKKLVVYTVPLLIAISFYLVLSHLDTVLNAIGYVFGILFPFLIGFFIAFVLNPLIVWLEKKLSKVFTQARFRKAFCTLIIFLLFITALVALFWVLMPALIESLKNFASNVSVYADTLEDYVRNFASQFNISYSSVQDFVSSISSLGQFTTYIQNSIGSFVSFSYNFVALLFKIIIGFAAAFYLLLDKDRLIRMTKQVIYALLPKRNGDFLLVYGKDVKLVFQRYIVGNILDSSIIGLTTWIAMILFGFPYAPVIGLVIGVTNLIPVFGPFMGAIPVILLLLLINPVQAVIFAIFILVLQQIDGNILKPVILGDQLGLSGFWILFAVTIGGSLFGVIGMFLGVPVFALIYEGIRDLVNWRLQKNHLVISEEPE